MRISVAHEFVFVPTSKVATQSLYAVLKNHFSPLAEYAESCITVPHKYKDYFTWSICRNPYTRTFSAWWAIAGSGSKRPGNRPRAKPFNKGMTFKAFVEYCVRKNRRQHLGTMRQTARFQHFKNDRIIRFESIETDFLNLPFVTEPVDFVCINTKYDHAARGGNILPKYSEVFTQELADLIYEWERETFKRFKYPRDSWKELP